LIHTHHSFLSKKTSAGVDVVDVVEFVVVVVVVVVAGGAAAVDDSDYVARMVPSKKKKTTMTTKTMMKTRKAPLKNLNHPVLFQLALQTFAS